MADETLLVTKMRRLADFVGGEQAYALREHAKLLEIRLQGLHYDEDGVRRMLGAWARARRLYCEIADEPLV